MNDEMDWKSNETEDTERNKEEQQIPPRYGYYQIKQEDEQEQKTRKSSKSENSAGKRIGFTIVLAILFGLVSGTVFQLVDRVSDKLFSTDETNIEIPITDLVESEEPVASAENTTGTYSVAGVAEACMPSVVAITSVSIQEIPSFFWYGTRQYQSAGSGSGIIVGENEDELLIATNNHVVEGATTLSVCFIGNDVVNAEVETENFLTSDGDINVEDAVSAKIKGTDAENDLAVIAVKKADIPEDTMSQIKIAQLGNSEDLIVGEQVVAIGNALGYGQSVTSGWVSALNRSVYMEDGGNADLIQTDAAINPGNSGGALLNMRGELIGINSAKYADNAVEGMGYAIPISKAQPILEELMNRKTREKVEDSKAAQLGISSANLSTEAIQMYNMPQGVFVIKTIPGMGAEEAGIRKGDIIIKMDGQRVQKREELAELLQYYEAGEEIEVVLARAENGEYVEVSKNVVLSSSER